MDPSASSAPNTGGEGSSSAGQSTKRSKTCSVCHGESETFHLNYGASTCFSCRAFFRRTVQKDCYSKYICKTNGNCPIDPQSRRKCQRCRFDQCMRAGMQPSGVLKQEDKQERFKKLLKKKEKQERKRIRLEKKQQRLERQKAKAEKQTSKKESESHDATPVTDNGHVTSSHGVGQESSPPLPSGSSQTTASSSEVYSKPRGVSRGQSGDSRVPGNTRAEPYLNSRVDGFRQPQPHQQLHCKNRELSQIQQQQKQHQLTQPWGGQLKNHGLGGSNIPQLQSCWQPKTETVTCSYPKSPSLDPHINQTTSAECMKPLQPPQQQQLPYEGGPRSRPRRNSVLDLVDLSQYMHHHRQEEEDSYSRPTSDSCQQLLQPSQPPWAQQLPSGSGRHHQQMSAIALNYPHQQDLSLADPFAPGPSWHTRVQQQQQLPQYYNGNFTSARRPTNAETVGFLVQDLKNRIDQAFSSDSQDTQMQQPNWALKRSNQEESEVLVGQVQSKPNDSTNVDDTLFKQPAEVPAKKLKPVTKEEDDMEDIRQAVQESIEAFDDSLLTPSEGDENSVGGSRSASSDESFTLRDPTFVISKKFVEDLDKADSIYTSYTVDDIDCPTYCTTDSRFRKRMFKFLEHIRRTWAIALKRMELNMKFVECLIGFHYGHCRMDKTLFKKHIVTLSKLFRDYAVQQPEFSSLTTGDQRKLLLRNTPIFLQYLMGRYFTAPSGSEQITWLLAIKIPDTIDQATINSAPLVTFNAFIESSNLFPFGMEVNPYEAQVHMLQHPVFLKRCNPLIAVVCMYRNKFACFFDDLLTIKGHLADVFAFAEWAFDVYNCASKHVLSDLVKSLEAISYEFEANISWDNSDGISLDVAQKILALPYGQVEEQWIYSKFDLVSNIYHNIPVGEEIIKEFIMYSYDVPLSKSFGQNILKVMLERFRSMMVVVCKSEGLSESQASAVIRDNIRDVCSLWVAKAEATDIGELQVQLVSGIKDNSVLMNEILPRLGNRKLKALSFTDTTKASKSMDEQTSKAARKISLPIGQFVKNTERFKMVLLILMLQQTDNNPSLNLLRTRVLKIFEKRIKYLHPDSYDSIMADLQTVMINVKKFSELIQAHWLNKPALSG